MSDLTRRPRSRMGAMVSAAIADARIEFPTCTSCGAVQYPPRDVCRVCLGAALEMAPCDPGAIVIASAAVHHSYAADFADCGRWPVALVKMHAGPIVFAHAPELLSEGTAVTLVALTDRIGDGVLGAVSDLGDLETLKERFEKQP